VPQIGTATWLGFVNYMTYKFNDNLSGTPGWNYLTTRKASDRFQGVVHRPHQRAQFSASQRRHLSAEVRYDYNSESRPFDGRHGLFTAGTDLILRW